MRRPDPRYRPVVYGEPGHTAVLLDSVTRLMEHEPDETFSDVDVRAAAKNLSDLLARRLARPHATRAARGH